MKKIPLSVKQIAGLLEDIHNTTSSGESDNYYSNSARHIVAYNALINLSKEELESHNSFNQPIFWNLIFGRRQNVSLFVAVAVEKEAFLDNFSHFSQWLIKNQTNDRTWEFYSLIGNIESLRKKATQQDIIENAFSYFHDLDSEDKKQLLNKFYKQYLSEKSAREHIISHIYNYPTSDLSVYLLDKCQQNDIDINASNILHQMLPSKEESYSFFISSAIFPILTARLKSGFKFNENVYRFNNDNLFTSLLKTKSTHMIPFMLPHIQDFTITSDKEDIFMKLKDTVHQGQSLYDLVYPFYFQHQLQQELNKNSLSTSCARKKKL